MIELLASQQNHILRILGSRRATFDIARHGRELVQLTRKALMRMGGVVPKDKFNKGFQTTKK